MPAHGPHVLLLSPGSKVALTRALASATLARGGQLIGWESDGCSPAAMLCQQRVDGGPVENAGAAHRLLEFATREHVRLIVPSRHDDLPTLAGVADLFAAAGIAIAVSAEETVALCLDKVACHAWLTREGFPVPAQSLVADLPASTLAGRWPLVAKHARGSGSRHVRICRGPDDLRDLPRDWIIQTLAPGVEFTVNTYVARDGRCLCEIPHERILVGDGEVVRGRTRRIAALMEIARAISQQLPGARGPLNIQLFWDAPHERATVIEINPRFGGGYPLAHEAGGHFVDWLLDEYLDARELPRLDTWEDDLMMVRYREAAFFRAAR